MVAPEFILFLMLDCMLLVWTTFEVLVNHLIDSDRHLSRRVTAKSLEPSDYLRRAA